MRRDSTTRSRAWPPLRPRARRRRGGDRRGGRRRSRVLTHPVLEAAARAAREGRCYRETPVTWRSEAGALIEGIVDLAYADEEGFVVVDFKTDRELDGALERYQRQVSIYAAAIAAATGRSARAVLMRV